MSDDLGASSITVPAEHEHEFIYPRSAPPGSVLWCTVANCIEMGVIDHRSRALRPLTSNERLAVICQMWEDLILTDALGVIHGRERAIQRIVEMRGYSPGPNSQ